MHFLLINTSNEHTLIYVVYQFLHVCTAGKMSRILIFSIIHLNNISTRIYSYVAINQRLKLKERIKRTTRANFTWSGIIYTRKYHQNMKEAETQFSYFVQDKISTVMARVPSINHGKLVIEMPCSQNLIQTQKLSTGVISI